MEDLYGDLDNYEEFDNIEQLKTDNRNLKQSVENMNTALNQLREDYDKLSIEHKVMETNFSSLLKTARAEIERKTQMIASLNTEKDQLMFRHINAGNMGYRNTIFRRNNFQNREHNDNGFKLKKSEGKKDENKMPSVDKLKSTEEINGDRCEKDPRLNVKPDPVIAEKKKTVLKEDVDDSQHERREEKQNNIPQKIKPPKDGKKTTQESSLSNENNGKCNEGNTKESSHAITISEPPSVSQQTSRELIRDSRFRDKSIQSRSRHGSDSSKRETHSPNRNEKKAREVVDDNAQKKPSRLLNRRKSMADFRRQKLPTYCSDEDDTPTLTSESNKSSLTTPLHLYPDETLIHLRRDVLERLHTEEQEKRQKESQSPDSLRTSRVQVRDRSCSPKNGNKFKMTTHERDSYAASERSSDRINKRNLDQRARAKSPSHEDFGKRRGRVPTREIMENRFRSKTRNSRQVVSPPHNVQRPRSWDRRHNNFRYHRNRFSGDHKPPGLNEKQASKHRLPNDEEDMPRNKRKRITINEEVHAEELKREEWPQNNYRDDRLPKLHRGNRLQECQKDEHSQEYYKDDRSQKYYRYDRQNEYRRDDHAKVCRYDKHPQELEILNHPQVNQKDEHIQECEIDVTPQECHNDVRVDFQAKVENIKYHGSYKNHNDKSNPAVHYEPCQSPDHISIPDRCTVDAAESQQGITCRTNPECFDPRPASSKYIKLKDNTCVTVAGREIDLILLRYCAADPNFDNSNLNNLHKDTSEDYVRKIYMDIDMHHSNSSYDSGEIVSPIEQFYDQNDDQLKKCKLNVFQYDHNVPISQPTVSDNKDIISSVLPNTIPKISNIQDTDIEINKFNKQYKIPKRNSTSLNTTQDPSKNSDKKPLDVLMQRMQSNTGNTNLKEFTNKNVKRPFSVKECAPVSVKSCGRVSVESEQQNNYALHEKKSVGDSFKLQDMSLADINYDLAVAKQSMRAVIEGDLELSDEASSSSDLMKQSNSSDSDGKSSAKKSLEFSTDNSEDTYSVSQEKKSNVKVTIRKSSKVTVTNLTNSKLTKEQGELFPVSMTHIRQTTTNSRNKKNKKSKEQPVSVNNNAAICETMSRSHNKNPVMDEDVEQSPVLFKSDVNDHNNKKQGKQKDKVQIDDNAVSAKNKVDLLKKKQLIEKEVKTPEVTISTATKNGISAYAKCDDRIEGPGNNTTTCLDSDSHKEHIKAKDNKQLHIPTPSATTVTFDKVIPLDKSTFEIDSNMLPSSEPVTINNTAKLENTYNKMALLFGESSLITPEDLEIRNDDTTAYSGHPMYEDGIDNIELINLFSGNKTEEIVKPSLFPSIEKPLAKRNTRSSAKSKKGDATKTNTLINVDEKIVIESIPPKANIVTSKETTEKPNLNTSRQATKGKTTDKTTKNNRKTKCSEDSVPADEQLNSKVLVSHDRKSLPDIHFLKSTNMEQHEMKSTFNELIGDKILKPDIGDQILSVNMKTVYSENSILDNCNEKPDHGAPNKEKDALQTIDVQKFNINFPNVTYLSTFATSTPQRSTPHIVMSHSILDSQSPLITNLPPLSENSVVIPPQHNLVNHSDGSVPGQSSTVNSDSAVPDLKIFIRRRRAVITKKV